VSRELLIALAGYVIFLIGLAVWYHGLEKQDAELSANVRTLEGEWEKAAQNLEDARRLKVHVRSFLDGTENVEKERGADRWSVALHSIAISVGPDVELWQIHVWKDPEDNDGRLLQIQGMASGTSPRLVADQFYRGLREELIHLFRNAERMKIERIEDVGGTNGAEKPQARFTIAAPIGALLTETEKQ